MPESALIPDFDSAHRIRRGASGVRAQFRDSDNAATNINNAAAHFLQLPAPPLGFLHLDRPLVKSGGSFELAQMVFDEGEISQRLGDERMRRTQSALEHSQRALEQRLGVGVLVLLAESNAQVEEGRSDLFLFSFGNRRFGGGGGGVVRRRGSCRGC